MDSIDKNILMDFMADCRITYQELALKHGMSANAIKKRVNKMIEIGVIVEFYVELSIAMIDAELTLCLVTTDGTEDDEVFLNEVGNNMYINTVGKASGSVYFVFAACINGSRGLSELGAFLRNLTPVTKVELHPLLFPAGKKVTFTTTQLMVLRHLAENPRISISELASKSGLTARMARKTIDGLKSGGGLLFGVRYNANAGDSIVFIARIHWDEKATDSGKVIHWLQKRFPDEFFVPMLSAVNPLVFISFMVNDLQRISEIAREIKKAPGISKVITIIGEPSKVFPDIRSIRLKELIAEAGF
ncbi:MAG: winged helix-turn-helix transcriptional regulator [Candidatus Odinarchaeota archaeon]